METVLSIIAVVVSTLSFAFSFYSFFWTARRDRKQATLEAYNDLQGQVLDKLNLYKPSEIAEIAKNNRSPQYKDISGYIARVEHFCVGVNTRIYDFNTLYELAYGYFDSDTLKKRIEPIVNRKLSHTEHDYYENIHRVWKKMDKKNGRKGRWDKVRVQIRCGKRCLTNDRDTASRQASARI